MAKPIADRNQTLFNFQLILIVIVASGLRIWNLEKMPFSYDEFSALFRTRFSSFHELIELGTKPDTHPPGIQSFLWLMVKFVGENSLMLKIPFVICGIASVVLTYDIAKQWFGRGSALLSSALLAIVQISVIQSQIIRPYSPGLFFCLLAFWSWVKFNKKANPWWLILFSFSLTASAYIHYFSLLQAALIFLIALVLSKAEHLKWVIFSGLMAVALFFPGIGVMLHQLGHGGIGSILGAPDLKFVLQYLAFLTHYSLPLALAIIGLLVAGIYGSRAKANKSSQVISLVVLAFVPGLIGGIYSILVDPILMERSLYFSLPFLLILIFSGIPETWNRLILVGTLSILTIGFYSLIITRQNFKMTYISGFQEVIKKSNTWNNAPNQNSSVLIAAQAKILEYESSNLNLETGPIHILDEFSQDTLFVQAVRSDSIDEIALARTMQYYSPNPSYEAFAYAYGYSLSEQENWFNSDFRVFRKNTTDLSLYNSIFPENLDDWSYQTSELESGKLTMKEGQEWGPSIDINLNEIVEHPNNELAAFAEIESANLGEGVELVSMILRGEETIHYSSILADSMHYPIISIGLKLADLNENTDDLSWKIFLWNKNKTELKICRIHTLVFPGNPYQYAWYQKIE